MQIIEKISRLRVQECLVIDAAFHLILGTALFLVPNLVLKATIADVSDGVHWHLARCLGAQMVGEALAWWYIAKSNHGPAHSSALMARIVGSTLWIAMSCHGRAFYSKHHHSFAFPLIIGSCFVFLLINIFQLVNSGWQMGHVMFAKNRTFNCLIQCDAFAALIIGCAWMVFPDWILSRQVTTLLTGAHLYLGRCMGAIFVSTHVLSAQALYWQHLGARKMWAYGRGLMCGGILVAQIWSQVAYGQWWSGKHWVGITLFSIWTTIAAWAVRNFHLGVYQ